MKLTRNWAQFKKQTSEFIENAKIVEQSHKSSINQEDYETLNTKYITWQEEVAEFLSDSFDDKNNEFVQGIRHPQTNRYHIGNPQKDSRQLIKEKLEDFSSLRKQLEYYVKILSTLDAIVRPDEINLEERRNYETDEILDLLMEKLYILYDDSYHPVSTILTGNGIQPKKHDEERQLAKTLEDWGYLNLVNSLHVNAQLTIEGKRYVEGKRRAQKTDYTKITETPDELNEKIDEIKEELRKLGIGQEILYEELDDLKELYPQLNKKNWGQILKGKLIDLGIAQIINKETMAEIFKELTKEVLRVA